MVLLNPLYAVLTPFLFLFTVPIVIFAVITSSVAFSILLLRATIVYFELALAVVPHYITARFISLAPSIGSSPNPSLSRRRKRRTSSTSAISAGSLTPTAESGLGLSQSVGAIRDYEGVGGWKLGDEGDDDGVWTKINSRLELPAEHGRRYHHRSLTSGSLQTEEGIEMNMSRVRTPRTPSPAVLMEGGYFSQVKAGKAASVASGNSGSSGSSKVSGMLSMKQRS